VWPDRTAAAADQPVARESQHRRIYVLTLRTWPYVAPLVFSSGACALVYEVTWLREFRSLFGASTLASATVLALFIGGLGIGSRILGPRVDRHEEPFAFYLRLEAMIAVLAAATPAWLWLAQRAYLSLGGSAVLGAFGGSAVRILLAAPVIVPPTILMGGTLPAAARAIESESSPGRHFTALLYGTNTLGAVSGATLTTFVLLEALGNRQTLWLASALNLTVVLIGLALRRRVGTRPPQSEALPRSGPPVPRELVLLLASSSGFVFFLMELVFYRMLAPILGGSVFTMGLILSVALLGIGLGGLGYSLRAARMEATLGSLSFTFALMALALIVPYALGDYLALLAAEVHGGSNQTFFSQALGWSGVTTLVVLPAAAIAGFQFPLLLALLGRGQRELGRQTGDVYAFNTLGSVLGALAGGFGLMSLLTAPGCWRAVVWSLLALSLLTLFYALRIEGRVLVFVRPWAATCVAIALSLADGPTAAWRHGGIGVGRFPRQMLESENRTRDYMNWQRRARLWEADGKESSVALMSLHGMAFVVNGKVDGHVTYDAPTQIMAGVLGAMLHGSPRKALVIGLGTGSTAGWLADIASMQRVDVFELEPAIMRVARDCAVVNRGALDNPKLNVVFGDGRELLLTSRERYDLIVSEPSNPYRAGIASLFTREFYDAIAERLAPGGLFVQWVQAYEVYRQAIDLVYATLSSSFPTIETWRTHRDLLLLASREKLAYSAADLRERIEREPYKSALRVSWTVAEVEGLLSYFIAEPAHARELARAHPPPLNTDDKNLLEFGFARSVGKDKLFTLDEALTRSRAGGHDRPQSLRADVDWTIVERERERLVAGPRARAKTTFDPGTATLVELLDRAVEASSKRKAPDPALLARLQQVTPYVADALRADAAQRSGQNEEALQILEGFFQTHRSDPWFDSRVVHQAYGLLKRIARQDPKLAERALSMISEPFAARAFNDSRLETVFELASALEAAPPCARALEAFEPWVPWNRAFLERRVKCYERNGDPRQVLAREDLEAFTAAQASENQN